MSKAESFIEKVKHVEEEIEAVFSEEHREKAAAGREKKKAHGSEKPAADGAAEAGHSSEYTVETENLAVPEIHTGKAEHKNPHHHADDAEDYKSGKSNKPSVQYDTLAVPEIHIPHGKK